MSNGPNIVPYYNHQLPTSYFRNLGLRGRLVLLLNWLRWKLARWCEYQVMILLAKRHGLGDRSTINALKLRWQEENEEQTRRRSVLSSFAVPGVEVGPPKHRYEEGRKNGRWPEDQTDEFARTLARTGPREGRYVDSRDTFSVQEVDAEPVK